MRCVGWPTLLAAIAALALAGCADKAKTLQAGAAQFEVESLSAIDKIDQLRKREVAATPLAPGEAADLFVRSVENSAAPIDDDRLELLLNPFGSGTPRGEEEWQAFLASLRLQYSEFAAIFASLDTGSFLAAPEVKRALPLLDPLIAQLAAFADTLQDHPATFIRDRVTIADNLEALRSDTSLTPSARRRLLLGERQRLIDLVAAEQRMTRDVIAQCLASAKLGLELRTLIADYDKLSLDDIAEGLSFAFRQASLFPGLDLEGLQTESDRLIGDIRSDPALATFLDDALGRLSTAR